MRKLSCCIRKNEGADMLRSYHVADQRLCFSHIDLLSKSEITSLLPSSMVVKPGCVGPDGKPRRQYFT